MIVEVLIIGFIYGYAFGNLKIMGIVKKKNQKLNDEIVEDTRKWWNSLLDVFKAKTKEQKIAELKKEIEELEDE